jgi:adenine/guanine phosphoribosyltransferase-like PRPP-binding protein
MNQPFRDRRDAGRLLAEKLSTYANRPDVIVLALPRRGVPVAYEVARSLNVPLDVHLCYIAIARTVNQRRLGKTCLEYAPDNVRPKLAS